MSSYFESLLDILNRHNSPYPIVILSGAGVSISSGLPSAKMFIEDAITHFSVPSECNVLRSFLDRERPARRCPGDWLRFEGVLDVINKTLDPNLTSLAIFQSNVSPNINHQILARFIEAGHIVLTTNFDCLIEQACMDQGIEVKVAFLPEHFEQNVIAQSTGNNLPYNLCKLHGSISDVSSIQATLSHIGKNGVTFNQNSPIRRFLESIISNHDIFVIGYSGTDDYDIVPLLIQTNSSASLWWVVHRPNAQQCQVISVDDLQEWHKDKLGYFYHPVAAIFEEIIQGNSRSPNSLRMLLGDGSIVLFTISEILLRHDENNISSNVIGSTQENKFTDTDNSWWKNFIVTDQDRNLFTARLYCSFGRTNEAIPFYSQVMLVEPRSGEIEFAEREYKSWLEFIEIILDSNSSENNNEPNHILNRMELISRPPFGMHALPAIIYMAFIHELAGYLNEMRKNFDGALNFYKKALEELREQNFEVNRVPNILKRKGCILRKQATFKEAIDCLSKAQGLFLEFGKMKYVADVQWELFMCYKDLGEDRQANDVLKTCRHFAIYGCNYKVLEKIHRSST